MVFCFLDMLLEVKYDLDIGYVDWFWFVVVVVWFGIGVDFFVNVFLCICGCE